MSSDPPPTLVFGPAYLDRVVRVDAPLLDPTLRLPPVDRSTDGTRLNSWRPADRLDLKDSTRKAANDVSLTITLPRDWDGPVGSVLLRQPLGVTAGRSPRSIRAIGGSADLGGMGAGFAALLGGTLVSALGPSTDPTSHAIVGLLDDHAIAHRPVRLWRRSADWTLLISSGPHGDKLAIGFRGCHADWTDLPPEVESPTRIRVVAALPNRLASAALGGGGGIIRAFFPNARAMLDRKDPLAGFAERIDLLSCNRGEWLDLGDGVGALDRVPIVAVTDGAAGATVRFVDLAGTLQTIHVPAFPRLGPIRDTNRAGEAFAGTLLATLVEAGWTPGPVDESLIRHAAGRAAAAAALVLGREGFGFATPGEVDAALRSGVAHDPPR